MWLRCLDRETSSLGQHRDRRRWCAGDACPTQTRVGSSAPVRFLEADLFSWKADRRYDAVFFGFWISHVPEDKFASFWSLVEEALEPGGRVFFFDDNHRTETELIEGVNSPVVQRRLINGTPSSGVDPVRRTA